MIAAFIMISLDGFFEGDRPWEIDWHTVDEEFNDFAADQLDEFDTLVFGRLTYDGMAKYWPSEDAIKTDPMIADRMNSASKVLVSRTLGAPEPPWSNTTLVRDARDLRSDKKLLVLGSAVLTMSLLEEGLLDELRIMVAPVLLGSGRSVASTATHRVGLELRSRREFRNGNVLLVYRPAPANMSA